MKIYPDSRHAKNDAGSSDPVYWLEKLAVTIAFISVFIFFIKLLFF